MTEEPRPPGETPPTDPIGPKLRSARDRRIELAGKRAQVRALARELAASDVTEDPGAEAARYGLPPKAVERRIARVRERAEEQGDSGTEGDPLSDPTGEPGPEGP